jgi:DNA primase
VLCFDGDRAGRKAAYRAIDTALPLIGPGKTLRFAFLPEGQDPDDLARSGGPAAVERVLKGAHPLVDVLWAREREAGPLDTPEQRAALERRLKDALHAIKDETLRRYYREDIEARLEAQSGGRPAAAFRGQRPGARPYGRVPQSSGAKLPAGFRTSPRLAGHPFLSSSGPGSAGTPASESPREAFILAALVVHPEWLRDHAELLVELDLAGRDAGALRAMLLDCVGSGEPLDPTVIGARLQRANLAEAAERLAARVRPGDRWALEPHADPLRLADALRQAIILHHRARTLHGELRAAERALADEENEANLAWLREVQNQLSSVEGAEADLDDQLLGREGGRGV